MSTTFFVDAAQRAGYLQLSAGRVHHLLNSLAYDIEPVAATGQLAAAELRERIAVVQRQFMLGHGREFSSHEVSEEQTLDDLHELDRLAARALEGGVAVLLL